MKSLISTTFAILFSITSFGQETVPVVTKIRGTKNISEVYYVLKSDKKTRHGTYTKYSNLPKSAYRKIKKGNLDPEKYILFRGEYDHGLKSGVWTEFSISGIMKEQGEYKNGKKTGIWVTAKEGGEVYERYDHDSDRRLQPSIEIQPVYPKVARINNLQGSVMVEYTINDDCSVTEIKILKSLSEAFDQSVIRAVERYGMLLKKYGTKCETQRKTFTAEFTME